MKQHATAAAVSAAIAVALTGCAGGPGAYSAGGSGASASPSGSASSAPYSRSNAYGDMGNAAVAGTVGSLHPVSTRLGTVLAVGTRTVYLFAADVPNSGRSACTGSCLTYWPPVLVPAVPKASAVAGKLGTIAGAGGKRQLTIDGHPLYTYVGDSASGDTNGQGLNLSGGLWWVVSPAGKAITAR